MHKSILRYQRARWLKWSIVLTVASIAAYAWHNPQPVANGGSWLGYTLGTIGALLIVWLTWFGVRKRNYRSTIGTAQGWLSAHVYLGTALLVVGTLHTGFQFAWNLHTLAYVLMCVVIFSGLYGIVLYTRYPTRLSDNRRNSTQQQLLTELDELDKQTANNTQPLEPSLRAAVDSSLELTELGGGAWRQLSGFDHSKVVVDGNTTHNRNQRTIIEHLAKRLGDDNPELNANIRAAIEVINRRSELLSRLRRDIRIRAYLDIWLFVHIPATVALLTALSAHIFVVFYYW